MENTKQNLAILIRTLAAHTNRAPSTISRLATGSGDTLRRIEAVLENGVSAHRISTDRVEKAAILLAAIWPSDLEWPKHIDRPERSKVAA